MKLKKSVIRKSFSKAEIHNKENGNHFLKSDELVETIYNFLFYFQFFFAGTENVKFIIISKYIIIVNKIKLGIAQVQENGTPCIIDT